MQESYSNENFLNCVRVLFVEILRTSNSYNENASVPGEVNIPAILGYIRKHQNKGTLEEIAKECGYHSLHHFTRTFRKMKGVSPLSFRTTEYEKDPFAGL